MFSIIVSVYKVEKYLPQCIESVLGQTYPEFELILVDDGSPDRCGEICDEYARKDARIKVLHQKNAGRVNARNAGLRQAIYDHIINVDGDDYIDSELLADLLEIIKKHNPDVIAYGCTMVSEEGAYLSTRGNDSEEGLYTQQKLEKLRGRLICDKTVRHINSGSLMYSIWSKAFKKELIEKAQNNMPEEIVVGEDLVVTVLAACNCQSLYVLNNYGYMYRQRELSTMHSFDEKEIRRQQILLEYLYREAGGLDNESVNRYCYNIVLRYIFQAIAYASKYRQFKKMLDSQKDELCMQKCLNLDPKSLGWKDRVRWFCIKHHLWWAFWMRCK